MNNENKSHINWDIGIYRQLTSNSYKIRKASKKFLHIYNKIDDFLQNCAIKQFFLYLKLYIFK